MIDSSPSINYVQCGGPSYAVQLGRRDGMSSASWKCNDLPSPQVDIPTAAAMFAKKGFNSFEMATLMGNYLLASFDLVLEQSARIQSMCIDTWNVTYPHTRCT